MSVGQARNRVQAAVERTVPLDAHEAVKRWLVNCGAHGASDFRVIPYGEAKPIAANSTAGAGGRTAGW